MLQKYCANITNQLYKICKIRYNKKVKKRLHEDAEERKVSMKRKFKKSMSVVMALSLAATPFGGYGLYHSPEVKAASDENTKGVLYQGSDYYTDSYDQKNKYDGTDLGCTYTKEATTFKVWSPEATKVTLKRYATGSDGEKGAKDLGTVEMTKGEKGVWSCTVKGDIVNTYYTYNVTVNNQTQEAVDIYAKAVGVNGDRAMVVDLDSTDPEGWDANYKREKTLLSDINVWEVHVRDFSIDVSSGVSEANRGKYKAFTEHTTVNGKGKVASCVDYLKELGVTHVQILPMYDYGSTDSDHYCVDERNVSTSMSSNYNWGYDPENFNVPEGSYSSNPYDGNVRITETKEMIQALHDAGIKVIMDVVYNHTYDTAKSNFNKIMPDYYYKVNGKVYDDQSGCGNSTRSRSAMYRKFMIDSVSYWAEEYNIDGFRFDLMGIHDVTTMNQIRSTLDKKFGEDKIIMYGEGWSGGSIDSDGAWKGNEDKLDDGIGFFNDQIRDSIKGDKEYNGTIGYVQTNYQSGSYVQGDPGNPKWPDNLFGGIMGSVGKSGGQWWMWRPFWSKSSNCSLNYTSAHDDLTLWDKFFQTGDGAHSSDFDSTEDRYIRMNKMSGAIINISKGGTFMQAGEEFCRSKYGVKNSYNKPDSTNKLDWTRLLTHGTVADYYKGMLQIRHVFSGFTKITTRSENNWNPNGNNYTWVSKDEGGVSTFIVTNDTANEWNKVAVIMNNKTTASTVDLGKYGSSWVIISDGNKAGIESISECGASISAAGKSVVVAVPKDTYDKNIESIRKKLEERQHTNAAPTIIVDHDNIEVAPGDSVSFSVTAKDADGDQVTLSASGVPEGAEFDVATGKFTWDSAEKGTYTVTVSATDGTSTTKKEIKISVVSATSSLDELINEVEAADLAKDELTDSVWKALQDALASAKELAGDDAATEAQCAVVKAALQKAFDNATGEKSARENLQKYVTEAEATIADAKEDNNDAELLKDAKTVLKDTKDLLEGVAAAKVYTAAQNNLEDSVASLAIGDGKPSIHVSAPGFDTPYVYAWTGDGTTAKTLLGEWPGVQLKEKDADGNYVYDISVDGKFNLIINNGKTAKQQTNDLKQVSGKVTVVVEKTSSSKDSNGNAIYTATAKSEEVTSVTPELFKTSLEKALTTAKAYDAENYTEASFADLQDAMDAAEKVMDNQKATQLEVNKAARALRAAYVSLEPVSADVIDPTEPPREVGTPSPIPEITVTPEGTPDVEEGTPTPEVTESPVESTKPTNTPVIPGVTNTPVVTTKPTSTPVVTKTPAASGSAVTTNTPVPTATAATGMDQTPASELTISSLTVSPALSQVVKKPIKVSARAAKATGTATYKFEVYRGTLLVASQDYSESNNFTFKVSEAGTYTVKVTATDTSKKEVVKSKKVIVVSKVLSMKLKKKIVKKKKLKVSATATGGLKSYKFKYAIKNAKGKIVKRTGYVANKTLSWKSKLAGKYTVQVIVKDATGTKVQKKLTVKLK